MSKWKYQLRARCPKNPDKDLWDVGIPEWYVKQLQKNNHHAQFARLTLVKEVLAVENTIQIVAGWNRKDKDDCFAYVGKPEYDCLKIGNSIAGDIKSKAKPGLVFVVFIMSNGTIDGWTWREVDPDTNTPSGMIGSNEGMKGQIIWTI